jgi:hypothetical protein
MDKAMDDFMVKYLNAPLPYIDDLKRDFMRSLHFCEQIWGEDSFKRLDKSSRVIQGMFDIQMVSVSLLNQAEYNRVINKPSEVRDSLSDEMNNNPEFLTAVTQFTSNANNVRYRILRFADILKSL